MIRVSNDNLVFRTGLYSRSAKRMLTHLIEKLNENLYTFRKNAIFDEFCFRAADGEICILLDIGTVAFNLHDDNERIVEFLINELFSCINKLEDINEKRLLIKWLKNGKGMIGKYDEFIGRPFDPFEASSYNVLLDDLRNAFIDGDFHKVADIRMKIENLIEGED